MIKLDAVVFLFLLNASLLITGFLNLLIQEFIIADKHGHVCITSVLLQYSENVNNRYLSRKGEFMIRSCGHPYFPKVDNGIYCLRI